MAFTYTLSTDVGKVRLKLADTNSSAYAFEDAEISEFLDEGGSVNKAVALGIRSLLASKALRVKRASLPGISYDDTAQVAALKDLLALYGGELPTVDVVSPDTVDYDSGFDDPTPTTGG